MRRPGVNGLKLVTVHGALSTGRAHPRPQLIRTVVRFPGVHRMITYFWSTSHDYDKAILKRKKIMVR
jgi:hypothetical protein